MLRYYVILFVVVLSVGNIVNATGEDDDHDVHDVETSITYELQDDGRLFVEFHAPADEFFSKVIIKVFGPGGQKWKGVDKTPEPHLDHQDWSFTFNKPLPFVACDVHRVKVWGFVIGGSGRRLEADGDKQIPGPDCS